MCSDLWGQRSKSSVFLSHCPHLIFILFLLLLLSLLKREHNSRYGNQTATPSGVRGQFSPSIIVWVLGIKPSHCSCIPSDLLGHFTPGFPVLDQTWSLSFGCLAGDLQGPSCVCLSRPRFADICSLQKSGESELSPSH